MGLYNFQTRFVPLILSGRKKHTIRAKRSNPDEPGNTLHLYTGLRQKGARLLTRVPCVKVEDISIRQIGFHNFEVRIGDQVLTEGECEALAYADGFENFLEMMHFWKSPRNRLPFKGHIIHWK